MYGIKWHKFRTEFREKLSIRVDLEVVMETNDAERAVYVQRNVSRLEEWQ